MAGVAAAGAECQTRFRTVKPARLCRVFRLRSVDGTAPARLKSGIDHLHDETLLDFDGP